MCSTLGVVDTLAQPSLYQLSGLNARLGHVRLNVFLISFQPLHAEMRTCQRGDARGDRDFPVVLQSPNQVAMRPHMLYFMVFRALSTLVVCHVAARAAVWLAWLAAAQARLARVLPAHAGCVINATCPGKFYCHL
jgi:hypothetical protein